MITTKHIRQTIIILQKAFSVMSYQQTKIWSAADTTH